MQTRNPRHVVRRSRSLCPLNMRMAGRSRPIPGPAFTRTHPGGGTPVACTGGGTTQRSTIRAAQAHLDLVRGGRNRNCASSLCPLILHAERVRRDENVATRVHNQLAESSRPAVAQLECVSKGSMGSRPSMLQRAANAWSARQPASARSLLASEGLVRPHACKEPAKAHHDGAPLDHAPKYGFRLIV